MSAGVGGASGGSGGTPSGTGGVLSGTGGTPSGVGGVPGTDAGVSPCVPGISPASALITNFSPATWNATLAQWGTPGNLTGTIFSYGGGKTINGGPTTLLAPPSVDTMAANPALSIRGDVVSADYAGIGMAFGQCVNTTAYSGLSFTLAGTTAGCDLFLQLRTQSQLPVSSNGACVANCFQFPTINLAVGAGPNTVTFAALAGSGLPATADAMRAEIRGLQFQFQSPAPVNGGAQPSCLGINLTLDDVRFVAN
ncbi:MAG TPA: hypothetical protein VFH68_17990 [Polyangia bacterium]|nr:hypothetical protein [Polyangia bacterium]